MVALSLGTFAATRPSDRERAGLKGPVRTVHVDVAYGRMNVAGPFVEARREILEETSYNAAGDIVSRRFFDNGAPVVVESWATLPDGSRLIHSNAPADDGTGFRTTRLRPQPQVGLPLLKASDGEYTFVRACTVDGAGRVTQETLYSGATVNPKTAYAVSRFVYSTTGLLTEIQRTSAQTNRLLNKVVYTYDRQKNVEQEYVYGPENLLLSRYAFTYEYDDRGNWTKRTGTRMDNDGGATVVLIRTITYDAAR